MAARRLIAIMITLLVVSSFAAALAPQERDEGAETETSTTTAPEPDPAGDGARLFERIAAGREEPRKIIAAVGDQLALTVEVGEPARVQIPELGRSQFATPRDPARFDLLLRESGRLAITAEGAGTVGTLEVAAAERMRKES